jgi:CRISP-associated protein Cas1
MILLLDSPNMHLSVKNALFSLAADDRKKLIAPKKIESIIVTNDLLIDKKAVILAADTDVSVYFLDKMGQTKAVIRSTQFNNASVIRRSQVWMVDTNEGAEWVKGLILHKLEGIETNLRYFAECLPSKVNLVEKALLTLNACKASATELNGNTVKAIRDPLLGYEGSVARVYWEVLSECLPEELKFKGRSKHPALDPFNAALNYLYGILYTIVETSIFTVGMDPQLGIYHADQYQKPTLAFDLIEVFRQWPERFLFDFFRENGFERSFFKFEAKEVRLDTRGKSVLIPLFVGFLSKRTTHLGKINSRRAHIQSYSGDLALKLFNLKI